MKSNKDYLLNKRFGKLIVTELLKNKKGRTICLCKCDCGNETKVEICNLVSGRTVSCGCRMKEINHQYSDIFGKKYHYLVVENKTDKRKDGMILWKCRCLKCGSYIEATKKQLDRGYVKDCGQHIFSDLIEKNVGNLKIISYDYNKCKYLCQCSCGNKTYVDRRNLITSHTKSCGCLQRKDNFERIEGAVPCMLTSKLSKRNTSGVKGVSQNRKSNWVAYITLKRKRYYLGEFKHKEDAVIARKNAEKKLYTPILEKHKHEKANKIST
ncbi:hypothetical protein SCB17_003335 [Clostridium perfringens]|nr:hypothetical protein [Clostridium perfringens]